METQLLEVREPDIGYFPEDRGFPIFPNKQLLNFPFLDQWADFLHFVLFPFSLPWIEGELLRPIFFLLISR